MLCRSGAADIWASAVPFSLTDLCSSANRKQSPVQSMKTKKARVSKSDRAGLQFPVSRVHTLLRSKISRVSQTAAVYTAAVLEYLTAEILELSGNTARDLRLRRITPRHISLAIQSDEEIDLLLGDRGDLEAILPYGGVIPYIHKALIKPIKRPKTKPKSSIFMSAPKQIAGVRKGKPFQHLASKASAAAMKSVSHGEIERRRAREGGKTGDLRVSLAWNDISDLAIHTTTPSGEVINWRHMKSSCGGCQDVDMNVHGDSTEPVENIVWCKSPPAGTYKVHVLCYRVWSHKDKKTPFHDKKRSVPFSVALHVRGHPRRTFFGAVKQGESQTAFSFRLGIAGVSLTGTSKTRSLDFNTKGVGTKVLNPSHANRYAVVRQ